MSAEEKEFFIKLDSQHLLLETYLYAIMGRFQVSSGEAGTMLGKHLAGDLHGV